MTTPKPSIEALQKAYAALLEDSDNPTAWLHWYEVLAAELGRAKKVVFARK